MVSVCLPMQGTQVPPLVLERRPPMPWGNEDHGQQPLVLVPPLEGRPTCHSKDPACRNSDLLQPKMNIKQTKPKQEKDPSRFQKPVQRRQPPPVSQQTGDFRPRVPCSVTLTASFSLPWLWLLCSPPRLPCREVRAPGCRPGPFAAPHPPALIANLRSDFYTRVLASWGRHNQTPEPGRYQQQTHVISQCWRLEVQGQGVGRVGSS